MDVPGIHGKPKSPAEFNCRLICKQSVGSSNLPVGSFLEYDFASRALSKRSGPALTTLEYPFGPRAAVSETAAHFDFAPGPSAPDCSVFQNTVAAQKGNRSHSSCKAEVRNGHDPMERRRRYADAVCLLARVARGGVSC